MASVHAHRAGTEEAPGVSAGEPGVLETYSVSYSLILLFLLPGVTLMSRLPFGDARSTTYSFEYVSLVTVPFVLGTALAFMLSSPEGWRRGLLRVAVLTPLVVVTGVTLMFGTSMVMIPASKLLGIREQGLAFAWWAGLALVSAPLAITLVRRMAASFGPSRRATAGGIAARAGAFLEAGSIALALCLVVGLTLFSFLVETNIYDIWRKDVVIYVVGALTWYAPSFGLAAGFWRRTGLV